MSYQFEWHPAKADSNVKKHGVSFEEAVTVFADPLSLSNAERNDRTRIISARKATRRDAMTTKKAKTKTGPNPDRDTMRPEYDFSTATRGTTAARYAEGANVVVIDPDLQPFFPTSEAVNDALRELASIAKRASSVSRKKRSA